MSGNEGDFSGRGLCVQLAESNPNKCVPLMKRFLSNTANSLNILSVHLHRTDIYAPMSVTLYMKYLFYIFSEVRKSVIPFQFTYPICHVELLLEIILENEETKTKNCFSI